MNVRLRSCLLAAGAVAVVAAAAAAAPAGAAPSFVYLSETLRPIEGRASEMIVAGQVHHAVVEFLESVAVEGEAQAVVVTVATFNLQFLDIDDPFAYAIELPPLLGGQHEVILRRREGGAPTTTEEVRGSFRVHPPIVVGLEPAPPAPGNFRIRASGSSSGAQFTGAPVLAGNTIRLPISLGCHLECVGNPPLELEWEITSEPIGLPAGRYTLELIEDPVPAGSARIAWRGPVEVPAEMVTVRDGYFALEVELAAPHVETPQLVMPVSADSALFYFFSKDNWELMVKVLDGCAINGHLWVYAAASTDVGYTLKVIDRFGGRSSKEYVFPGGAPAPALTDGEAFVCPCPVCSGG